MKPYDHLMKDENSLIRTQTRLPEGGQVFALAQTWHARISYTSQALVLVPKQAYVPAMSRQGGQIHAENIYFFSLYLKS